MQRTYIFLIVLLILVGYGYYTIIPHRSLLGEASFFKDEHIELKVVLIHENLFLHYVGNSYSVACQSQNTREYSVNDDYESKFYHIGTGWALVPGGYLGNGLGANKDVVLENLAAEAKKVYLVKDKMTFVFVNGSRINVTFDGCGNFREWTLEKNLPVGLSVESTPEFEACIKQQKEFGVPESSIYGTCSRSIFEGDNKPVFQDIVADSRGKMSFKVTTRVFKNNEFLNVVTGDFGKTWQVNVSRR